LTEAAEYTNPFTLQYVAGHKNIKTTMRYVHPQANAVDKLFGKLAQMRRGGDKNGYTRNSGAKKLTKSFVISYLQRAEVVELADTPS
jgi:hypothetical protein